MGKSSVSYGSREIASEYSYCMSGFWYLDAIDAIVIAMLIRGASLCRQNHFQIPRYQGKIYSAILATHISMGHAY